MSMEQGDLFGTEPHADASLPPKKPYSPPTPKKTLEDPPKPTAKPPPRKNLTYKDYLKIHCGNKAAANYWFMRNEGRPLI